MIQIIQFTVSLLLFYSVASFTHTEDTYNGVVTNNLLGIHEFLMRGSIFQIDVNQNLSLIPLLQLKWLQLNATHCRFRGFMLPTIPENHCVACEGGGESFRGFLKTWVPQIVMKNILTDDEIPISIGMEYLEQAPYTLEETEVACVENNAAVSYQFIIKNWISSTINIVTPLYSIKLDRSKEVFVGNKSFHALWAFTDFRQSNSIKNKIEYHFLNLKTSLDYSLRQGFSNYILYLHPTLFNELLNFPQFKLFMESKKVFVFLFDRYPMYPLDPYAWRQYTFQHALLGAWGNDVYFTSFDKDEVLGVPSKTTLFELATSGCLKEKTFYRLPMTLNYAQSV
jgi:hypothetical protein